jgi:tRNA A37 threonylcarbamoyladenosine dehydratase
MERFSRTEKILGREKIEKLQSSSAAIFGAGAVGSFAAEALVRSGIGQLTMVDFDEIQLSNINRQIFAFESTLGRPKAETAVQRLADINPGCVLTAVNRFADADSIPEILSNPPDIILDAIDSIGPKIELFIYAAENNIRVVSSMGAARRLDLARLMRKSLRRRGIYSGIPCVYSIEAAAVSDEGLTGSGGSSKQLGSLPTVTGVFGLVLADTAIKIITG